MKRTSYQNGSVVRKKRSLGPDVWVFRYMDGDVQRAKKLGTVDKFPTKAAAEKKAAKYREEINDRVNCIKVSGLCDRYLTDAIPTRVSTAGPYKSYLKRFKAEWGDWRVDVMAKDIMAIENWIDEMKSEPTEDRTSARGKFIKGRPARPLSKKTRNHMKWFIHRLFELAIKWGYLSMQRNPILLVEVKGKPKRVRRHNLITTKQWIDLIDDPELSQHVRVMVFIAMLLGLRASEILGRLCTSSATAV